MQILPKTKGAWSRVALLPFKVYVLGAYICIQIYLSTIPRRRYLDSDLFLLAILGYAVCFVVFSAASIGQGRAARHWDFAVSLLFAVLAGFLGYLLLPGLAH